VRNGGFLIDKFIKIGNYTVFNVFVVLYADGNFGNLIFFISLFLNDDRPRISKFNLMMQKTDTEKNHQKPSIF
jgi:hypothetical protein